MDKIKFNNTEFEVESYNRNTSFFEGNISSSGYFSVKVQDIDEITELAQETITSIQIIHDNEVIYNLSDIEAHIDNTVESYNGGDRIYTNINLIFVVN